MPKPTKAQLEQRVSEILSIRLAGAQFWDARQYVSEKEAAGEQPWTIPEGGNPLSERTLWRYIDRADKFIESSVLTQRKKALRRHKARREYLYAMAVNQGDTRAALAVLDSAAKLSGLFDDELVRQIDELQKQIAEIRNGIGSATSATQTTPLGIGDDPSAGESNSNQATPGPGADSQLGGTDAGPLAADVTPLSVPASIVAGNATGG